MLWSFVMDGSIAKSGDEIIKPLVEEKWAVSYTHLDVYKRQQQT